MAGDIGFAAAEDRGLGVASAGQDGRPQGLSGVAATPFTPGPWAVSATDDSLVLVGRLKIASAFPIGLDDEQERANASLMAAAPDMHEALHDVAIVLRAILEKPDDETRRHHAKHFLARADAALSKAEGRS
jgi:hypothetical protein